MTSEGKKNENRDVSQCWIIVNWGQEFRSLDYELNCQYALDKSFVTELLKKVVKVVLEL